MRFTPTDLVEINVHTFQLKIRRAIIAILYISHDPYLSPSGSTRCFHLQTGGIKAMFT